MTYPSAKDLKPLVQRARATMANTGRPPVMPEPIGPGEESVWDFPRPPAVQTVADRVRVLFGGQAIADTTNAIRVAETAGAPVYFIPEADIAMDALSPSNASYSICEWKGAAVYFDLSAGGKTSEAAAFGYPDPLTDLVPDFARLPGRIAFYAGRVDEAWVGDTMATPQAGGLYAGWVTPKLKGPIKGAPGTGHW